MEDGYSVYWAPGCSSCLRTKEFLVSHDVPFESINVAQQPGAMEALAKLGLRSIPVVRQGDRAIYCQDLQDVADFIGVALVREKLAAVELVEKTNLVMLAAQRFVRQLAPAQLNQNFPGRDRPFRDLAYHIFMVVQGYLESVRGGCLTEEAFLRTCPPQLESGQAIAQEGERIRQTFMAWWDEANDHLPAEISTYYGDRTLESVLERTAWHAAQHCRQLQAIVEMNGLTPNGPLGPAELAGLPLPKHVYDDEIAIDDADVQARPLPESMQKLASQ